MPLMAAKPLNLPNNRKFRLENPYVEQMLNPILLNMRDTWWIRQ